MNQSNICNNIVVIIYSENTNLLMNRMLTKFPSVPLLINNRFVVFSKFVVISNQFLFFVRFTN